MAEITFQVGPTPAETRVTSPPPSPHSEPTMTQHRRLPALIVFTIALLIAGLGFAPPSASAPAFDPRAAEREFVQLLNEHRARHGLAPLVVNHELAAQSRAWSGHMASVPRLYHDPNLAASTGLILPDWTRVGENVGTGYADSTHVRDLHDAFVRSSGHERNMRGAFNQVGIGVTYSGSSIWVTVRFAQASLPAAAAQTSTVDEPTKVYLANSLRGGAADAAFYYGRRSDRFVVGDWDGNGTDTPGVRRSATFHLRNSNSGGTADLTFTYGRAGDVVLVGDWDGDGDDTLAVRRGHMYYFSNGLRGGPADVVVAYGRPSDEVLVGDWDGDGRDTLAVRRGNTFYVRNSLSTGLADGVFSYGRMGDEVLVGDWNADGTDTFAVRRASTFYVRNALTTGVADATFPYGRPDDEAVAGDWNGDGFDTFGLRR